jgi:undecaprenyl phosphate-alpha-L-ara4FN deformylase
VRTDGRTVAHVVRVALKLDVDTYSGLSTGLPRLLDVVGRRGVTVSVYVAMGPDNSGRAVRRFLTQRGFARKMFRGGALRLYGLRTALSGTLLGSAEIARSFPDLLRRVVAEGHELGVHGYDHVYWHDRVVALPGSKIGAEIERALAVFREIIGGDPEGFAAPGWQCSAASISCLDRGPFVYHSSTRGARPYRPRIDGIEGRLPEIPTTLPTLDELLALGIRADEALDGIRRSLHEDDLNVLTVHAEVEGGPYLDAFVALVDRLRPMTRFERLVDVAKALDVARLPVLRVAQETRPGRAGTVSCQIE